MMETVRRKLGAPCSAYAGAAVLEDGPALVAAVQSKIQNPKSKILLLGTAFAFVRLLDAIRSLPLPPGSRVMETGGYKGRSREVPRKELHALIDHRRRPQVGHEPGDQSRAAGHWPEHARV